MKEKIKKNINWFTFCSEHDFYIDFYDFFSKHSQKFNSSYLEWRFFSGTCIVKYEIIKYLSPACNFSRKPGNLQAFQATWETYQLSFCWLINKVQFQCLHTHVDILAS